MPEYWQRHLRNRGGNRQKERHARLLETQERGHLSWCFLQLFSWGLLSASTIQWLAAAAVADGIKDDAMIKLAKLGTDGAREGNIRRDLLKKFLPD